MIYRNFEIKKESAKYGEVVGLFHNNIRLTQFVTVRALKSLIDRYYNNTLNAFEKAFIFNKMVL